MLIFGPGKYRRNSSAYLGALLCGHLGFVALGSLLFLAGSLGFRLAGAELLSSALLGLALAGSFILFQWLMRRACYVHLAPRLAASGGLLYMAVMLGGSYLLYQCGWLSTIAAFGLMGTASLAAGLWLVARLHVSRPLPQGEGSVREAMEAHWKYGRWAAATGVLIWIPGNIFYLLLPIWEGLEATAALRALMNLLEPVFHLQVSLSLILTPYLVQARGSAAFGSLVRLALTVCISAATLYCLALIYFQVQIVGWLYDGKYDEYTYLLWIVGFLPLLGALVAVLGAALRALERPAHVFWAQLASTAVTLTVGLGALIWWGVVGAAVTFLISWTVAPVIMAVLLVEHERASPESRY
jgi:O-antigen/teichoic acid export membrane protein